MSAPDLHLHVPDAPRAWERTQVTLSVRNRTRQPILPIVLRLASESGEIERWGIHGRIIRWGQRVPTRRGPDGWEVLAETLPQQLAAVPDRTATAELVRIDPLRAGESVTVQASFDATYAHAGELAASLTYVGIDPARQAICAADAASATTAYVPCRPVAELRDEPGVSYYLAAAELEHDRRSVTTAGRLSVRHPDFDVAEARSLAGVAAGPFGYDVRSEHWILVDETARRTVVVGRAAPVMSLPGDWLRPLTTLNALPAASIAWRAKSMNDAATAVDRLAAQGIDAALDSHKGAERPNVVRVTLRREDVEAVAALMRELGAEL